MTNQEAISKLEYLISSYVGREEIDQTCYELLDYLHDQEPRVMTLEYFDNSPDKDSKGCLVAWVEYRRDEEWAEYWEGTCDEWSVIRRDDFYSGESYRFWTSRPTDEQKEKVKWE